MEKTSLYKNYFLESLKAKKKSKDEDENTVGGALGSAAGAGNTQGDFYAPGDARIPSVLGGKIQRRNLPALTMNLAKGSVFSGNISTKKKRRKNKKKK